MMDKQKKNKEKKHGRENRVRHIGKRIQETVTKEAGSKAVP
jgi:hypothetical protein